MTTSYCLSPVLRFNKAYWIYYNCSLLGILAMVHLVILFPRVVTHLVTQVLLLGLWIDLCVSIYILKYDVFM